MPSPYPLPLAGGIEFPDNEPSCVIGRRCGRGGGRGGGRREEAELSTPASGKDSLVWEGEAFPRVSGLFLASPSLDVIPPPSPLMEMKHSDVRACGGLLRQWEKILQEKSWGLLVTLAFLLAVLFQRGSQASLGHAAFSVHFLATERSCSLTSMRKQSLSPHHFVKNLWPPSSLGLVFCPTFRGKLHHPSNWTISWLWSSSQLHPYHVRVLNAVTQSWVIRQEKMVKMDC